MDAAKRIVVAITGTSGFVNGLRLLEELREQDVESHFVISPAGRGTLVHETDCTLVQVEDLAEVGYGYGGRTRDIAAPPRGLAPSGRATCCAMSVIVS